MRRAISISGSGLDGASTSARVPRSSITQGDLAWSLTVSFTEWLLCPRHAGSGWCRGGRTAGGVERRDCGGCCNGRDDYGDDCQPPDSCWRRMFSDAAVSWALVLSRARMSASACLILLPSAIWPRGGYLPAMPAGLSVPVWAAEAVGWGYQLQLDIWCPVAGQSAASEQRRHSSRPSGSWIQPMPLSPST